MQVEIDEKAPVVASAEALVNASPEMVWDVLTDFENWPLWNSGVSQMRFEGDLKEGAVFTWTAGRTKIKSVIEEMEPFRRIAWSGRTFGAKAVHTWDLEVLDGGTHVLTKESLEGVITGLFKASVNRMLERTLEQAVLDLKKEAESRQG